MLTDSSVRDLLNVERERIIRRSAISATILRRLIRLVRTTGLSFGLRVRALLLRVDVTAISNIVSATDRVSIIILRRGRVRRASTVIRAAASLRDLLLRRARA